MQPYLHPSNPVLIVDGEASRLLSVDTELKITGINNTIACQDSQQVLELMAKHPIEAMLLDVSMPDVNGHRLLDAIHRQDPDVPMIVLAAAFDVATAADCIKAGAFDYLVRPVETDRLVTAVNQALSFREKTRENQSTRQPGRKGQPESHENLANPDVFKKIVTANNKMFAIFQYVEAIATTLQPVLIRGETGVGKELIARTIHEVSRLKGKFVAVNAAGLDDTVFSDTFFGHVKGAFTGADTTRNGLIEQANGGTLFLDEIGDLSQASQVKLLRLLQEGEYYPLGSDTPRKAKTRIIAATNQDLSEYLREGRFRKDLNYRLRTHRIYIPPLRERLDDIPLLLDHFLGLAASQLGKTEPAIPRELVPLLSGYSYPGNIREMEAMVFDAVSRYRGGALPLYSFNLHILGDSSRGRLAPGSAPNSNEPPIRFSHHLPTIKEAAQLLVDEALRRSGGNQSRAARMLGISQQALSKRLINMRKKSKKGDPENA